MSNFAPHNVWRAGMDSGHGKEMQQNFIHNSATSNEH